MCVLFVDDEPNIVKWAKKELTRNGYEVETSGDGVEALAKIQLSSPDLLVCDIMMPEMGGHELKNYLRSNANFDKMKVILLSNMAGETDRSPSYERLEEANTLGVDALIRKPNGLVFLLYTVNDVLGQPQKQTNP